MAESQKDLSSFQMESLFPDVFKNQRFPLTRSFVQFMEGSLHADDLRTVLLDSLTEELRAKQLAILPAIVPVQTEIKRAGEVLETQPADEHDPNWGRV